MNEWLYDELAELEQTKQDQTAKDKRRALLQQQTAVIWNDLKPVLQDAVQKMNETSQFRKLTGGIVHAPGVDRVEIRKQTTLPAVELVIAQTPVAISLEYTCFKSPRGHGTPKRQTLQVDLDDDGRPFFKNDEGKALTIEEATRQIMRPFLHPELLD